VGVLSQSGGLGGQEITFRKAGSPLGGPQIKAESRLAVPCAFEKIRLHRVEPMLPGHSRIDFKRLELV
jgi:hypothetical protein